MTWTTKKDDLVKALDEISGTLKNVPMWAGENWDILFEQIGKLRSLVDHLPEQSEDK